MDNKSTIEILSNINKSVAQIASYVAPKNKGEAEVKQLSKGGAGLKDSGGKSSGVALTPGSADSIKTTISLIAGITPNINKIAKMSGAKMGAFEKVVNQLISVMAKMIEFSKKNEKAIETLTKFMQNFTTFFEALPKSMLKMLGAFILMIPMAPLALIGLILTIPVFLLYAKIMQIIAGMNGIKEAAENIKNMADSIKPMINFMWSMFGLVVACIVVGALLQIPAVQKSLLWGLAVLGVTILAMAAVIVLTWLATKLLQATNAMENLKQMIIFMYAVLGMVFVCLLVGMFLQIPAVQDALWYGIGVLITTIVLMVVIIRIAGWAAKMLNKSGGLKNIKQMMIFTYASMGLIVAAYFLGIFIKDKWKDTLIGLGATIAVVLAVAGLAFIAGKIGNSSGFKKGLIAMAAIELLCVGAMGLLYMAVDLSQKFLPVWADVLITLGAVIGILVLFGALAYGASFILVPVLLGTVAVGAITLMLFLTIKMMENIIEFVKYKEESGKGWDQIAKDVAGLGLVTAEFGLLASGLCLLTIPLTLALPAILITTKFAKDVLSIVFGVLVLTNEIEKSGGIAKLEKTVKEDMPKLFKSFTKKNYDIPMSIFELGKLELKIMALCGVITTLALATAVFGKIAELGQMIEGNMIKPVLKVNEETGEITYGNPVDVKNVATVIMDATNAFVSKCDYGWKDVKKMLAAAAVFTILGMIVDPISTFLNMLTSFTVGKATDDGNTTLAPVRIDEKGNVKVGQPVDVVTVANAIASAVLTFCQTLFSEENAQQWEKLVYGEKVEKTWYGANKKSAQFEAMEAMMGIFSTVIAPVSSFIDVISCFVAGDDGKLYKPTQKEDGTWDKGQPIDVKKIAGIIADAVTEFANGLFGPDGLNAEKFGGWFSDKDAFSEVIDLTGQATDMVSNSFLKLADEKINSTLALMNAMTFRTMLITLYGNPAKDGLTLESANTIKTLASYISFLGNPVFINADGIEKNANAVFNFVDKVFVKALTPRVFTNMDMFTIRAINLSKSFKELDEALLQHRREREDALKELGNKLKYIVDALNNRTSDYLSDLATLMTSFSNANPEKIRLIMDYIKSGSKSSPSKAVTDTNKAIEGMDKIEVSSDSSAGVSTLSTGNITTAIKNALDDMRMFVFEKEEVTNKGVKELIPRGYKFDLGI